MTHRARTAALGIALALGLAACSPARQDPDPPKNSEDAMPTPAADPTPPTDEPEAEATPKAPARLARATFGGGCFWCLEAVFERLPGVKSVVSGYAGGDTPRPSYETVCSGLTGHAEVVQIEYDPAAISYDELLGTFFACHDPTTLNAQGPDHGTQYRSIILAHNQRQAAAARKKYEELTAANAFGAPIVTELVPLQKFWPAETYHQDYYRKHPTAPYCRMMIAPKLHKLGLGGGKGK